MGAWIGFHFATHCNASSRFRTVWHVLWLKLQNLLLSQLSSDLCTGSRSSNAFNINSFHLPIKILTTSQPDYLHNLISVQSSGRTRSSVVTLARPSVSSSLQITNRSFRYASPHRCGINSLLHSVNLIVFTLLLVHLILRISPHHSHRLRSHHLSLPQPFTPDLKLISFTNPFLHSLC